MDKLLLQTLNVLELCLAKFPVTVNNSILPAYMPSENDIIVCVVCKYAPAISTVL